MEHQQNLRLLLVIILVLLQITDYVTNVLIIFENFQKKVKTTKNEIKEFIKITQDQYKSFTPNNV